MAGGGRIYFLKVLKFTYCGRQFIHAYFGRHFIEKIQILRFTRSILAAHFEIIKNWTLSKDFFKLIMFERMPLMEFNRYNHGEFEGDW